MKMRDVAEKAGVSPATVSRVLNGVPTVGAEHRERVLKVIEEMGYRPNRLASNLRRQKAEVIGLVVSDVENPHFAQMVRAVEDAAYRRGYRVLLCNTDETVEKQRAYLEVLASERVLGVILSPSDPDGEEISDLLDFGIPIVAFDRTVTDPRADSVVVDNAGGAREATEHLLKAGHTHVGFIGGLEKIDTGADRLAGYEAAMRHAGLEPRSISGRFRTEEAQAAATAIIDADGLTALVVANNLMAIGVMRAIRDKGLRVPDDLALVSIDDPPWAELVDPPLTTLAQPVREMAAASEEVLFERIDGGREESRRVVFDFELKVRGSCGTAAIPHKGGK